MHDLVMFLHVGNQCVGATAPLLPPPPSLAYETHCSCGCQQPVTPVVGFDWLFDQWHSTRPKATEWSLNLNQAPSRTRSQSDNGEIRTVHLTETRVTATMRRHHPHRESISYRNNPTHH